MIVTIGLVSFSEPIQADGKALLNQLSRSEGNLELFDVGIHPGLGADYKWDDNIHYEPTNKDEDHISVISPGILLNGGQDYRFLLGFAYDRNIYSDNSSESFNARHGLADISLNFPMGLRFNLNDTYLTTKLPRDDADSPQRAGYMNNKGGGSVGYTTPSGKLSVDLSFLDDNLRYDRDRYGGDVNSTYNRRNDQGGLGFSYKFLPKTTFLLNFGGGKNDYYDRSRDDLNSQTRLINSGLAWDITSRINISVLGGWRKIYMVGKDFGDVETGTFNANLLWKMDSRWAINSGMSRDFFTSEYLGNPSKSLSSSAFYREDRADMGVIYQPLYNLQLRVHGNYASRNYVKLESSLNPREDRVLGGGVNIHYDFQRWLYFAVDYSNMKVLSNDDLRDYNKNVVSFSTGMVF